MLQCIPLPSKRKVIYRWRWSCTALISQSLLQLRELLLIISLNSTQSYPQMFEFVEPKFLAGSWDEFSGCNLVSTVFYVVRQQKSFGAVLCTWIVILSFVGGWHGHAKAMNFGTSSPGISTGKLSPQFCFIIWTPSNKYHQLFPQRSQKKCR